MSRPKRQACDALENRFRELYRAAGLRLCSSHSGRRTYSTRLLDAGLCLDTLANLLGHVDIETTACYVAIDKARLRQMYVDALS